MTDKFSKIKKTKSLEVAFVVVILFIVAIIPRASSVTTGLTWDEPEWLQKSSKFISAIEELNFQQTVLDYHPGVTTGWIAGIAVRLKSCIDSGGNPKKEVVSYGLVGDRFHFARGYGDVSSEAVAARFSMALVMCVMILGIYFLTRKLFNRAIAFLGTLMIALDPFYIAHSRFILTDALLTTFMVLSVLSLLVYIEKGRQSCYAVISGVFCGLACLSKTNGFFLFPFTFIVLLLFHQFRDRRLIPLRFSMRMFLGWVSISLLTFCVLWPKCWIMSVDIGNFTIPCFLLFLPMLFFIGHWGIKKAIWTTINVTTGDLYRTVLIGIASILVFALLLMGGLGTISRMFFYFGSNFLLYTPNPTPQVFFGKTYLDPGPLYFTVVSIMKTPPLTLLLLLISIPYLFRNTRAKDFRRSLIVLWAYVLLFDIAVSIPVKKYPRYILPVFPAMDILVAFTMYSLVKDIMGIQWVCRFNNMLAASSKGVLNRFVFTLFIYSVPVLSQLGAGLSVHPYYLAYYSPIWGGRANAPNVIGVGRGEGLDKVRKYLDSKKKEGIEYHVLYVPEVSAGLPKEDVMRVLCKRNP